MQCLGKSPADNVRNDVVDPQNPFLESKKEHRTRNHSPTLPRSRKATTRSILNYITEALKHKEIRDKRTTGELCQRAITDIAARNELVEGYLRLPLKGTRRVLDVSGCLMEDLLQEGNIGLIEAAGRFGNKEEAESNFINYAEMWIWQRMSRFMIADRTVPLPVRLEELRREIIRKFGDQNAECNQDNTGNEFYSLEGICREWSNGTHGSDLFVFEDDHSQEELQDLLRLAMVKLKPQQREVLTLRYGLLDEGDRTLQETGDILGLTRERIRQIEEEGLEALKRQILKILGKDNPILPATKNDGSFSSFSYWDLPPAFYHFDLQRCRIGVINKNRDRNYLDWWGDINRSRSQRGIFVRPWLRETASLAELLEEAISQNGEGMTPGQLCQAMLEQGIETTAETIYEIVSTRPDRFAREGTRWRLLEEGSELDKVLAEFEDEKANTEINALLMSLILQGNDKDVL